MRPPIELNEEQSCNTFILALCVIPSAPPPRPSCRQANPFFGSRFVHSYAPQRRHHHHHHPHKENGIGKEKDWKWRRRKSGTNCGRKKRSQTVDGNKCNSAATMAVTHRIYSAIFAISSSPGKSEQESYFCLGPSPSVAEFGSFQFLSLKLSVPTLGPEVECMQLCNEQCVCLPLCLLPAVSGSYYAARLITAAPPSFPSSCPLRPMRPIPPRSFLLNRLQCHLQLLTKARTKERRH